MSQLGHSTLLCRHHWDNSKCSKMKYKRVLHGSSLVSVGAWNSSAQGLAQRKCLGKGWADRGGPSLKQAGAGNAAERDLRLCVHLRFIICSLEGFHKCQHLLVHGACRVPECKGNQGQPSRGPGEVAAPRRHLVEEGGAARPLPLWEGLAGVF